MSPRRYGRRRLLRAAGGATVAATAGCTATLLHDDPTRPTPDARSAYADWWPVPEAFDGSHTFPAPTAFGVAEGVLTVVGPHPGVIDERHVVHCRPAALTDAVEDLHHTDVRFAAQLVRRLGVSPADVERFTGFTGGLTFAASVGPDALVARLIEADYEQQGEHRGFDVYASGDGYGVAVKDAAGGMRVVTAPRTIAAYVEEESNVVGKTGSEVVRTILDAEAGQTGRYVDADDEFAAVSDAVGSGALTAVSTHDRIETTETADLRFDGLVAEGGTLLPGDPGRLLLAFRFASADTAEAAAVGDAVSSADRFDRIDVVSTDRGDRSVRLDANVPGSAVPDLLGVPADDA